jgi:hypothetical protein
MTGEASDERQLGRTMIFCRAWPTTTRLRSGVRAWGPSYLTLHFRGCSGPCSERWRQDNGRFEGKGKECRDTEEGECD